MLKRILPILAGCVSLLLTSAALTAEPGVSHVYESEHGTFKVTYESQLSPIVINKMHSWTLHVEDAAGKPVSDADIEIKGGMPAHNHGLATDPSISPLGDGAYLLEGLRFHMMGHWELVLTIHGRGKTDKVTIPLDL